MENKKTTLCYFFSLFLHKIVCIVNMFMELYDEKVVWLRKWGQFFIVPQFFGKMKVLTSGLMNVIIPSGKRIRMVWLWIFYKSWKAISFPTSWFSRRGEKQILAMRVEAKFFTGLTDSFPIFFTWRYIIVESIGVSLFA